MTSNWYHQWFDSEYYHLLYDNRDETEAEKFLNNLLKIVPVSTQAHILDTACGRGRHARYLSSKGFQVDAFDLSENSINFAKDFESPNLHFYVHDMRSPFRENYYDLVLNLFTSFGYFEDPADDQRVFDSLVANLKAESKLVIDFLNPFYVSKHLDTNKIDLKKHSVSFQTQKEIVQNTVVKNIEFYDNSNAEQGSYKEKVKLLGLEDFKNLAQKAGVDFVDCYGNYDLDVFDPGTSPRQIMIFQK